MKLLNDGLKGQGSWREQQLCRHQPSSCSGGSVGSFWCLCKVPSELRQSQIPSYSPAWMRESAAETLRDKGNPPNSLHLSVLRKTAAAVCKSKENQTFLNLYGIFLYLLYILCKENSKVFSSIKYSFSTYLFQDICIQNPVILLFISSFCKWL